MENKKKTKRKTDGKRKRLIKKGAKRIRPRTEPRAAGSGELHLNKVWRQRAAFINA